jgi:thiamine biosynthesis lipoprotein
MDIRRARPLLGTLVEIGVDGLAHAAAVSAIDEAFGEIAAVHRLMSFHSPDSDVSRLHRDGARTPVRVDPRTIDVLAFALTLARESMGRFDPTVAAELVRAGFLPKPCNAPLPARDATWRDIEIVDREHVRFARPLWIDLGGVAKGYAVDRATDRLHAHGVATALVNAGGDLRRIGLGTQTVHVRDPDSPTRLIPLLELGEGAVATSAGYFERRTSEGRSVGPHFDGATRVPIDPALSVSVLADTCMVADALTKVVLADRVCAEPLLHRYGGEAVTASAGRWRRLGHAA